MESFFVVKVIDSEGGWNYLRSKRVKYPTVSNATSALLSEFRHAKEIPVSRVSPTAIKRYALPGGDMALIEFETE